MNESQIRNKLKTWIREHSKAPAKGDIADDTKVLELGILSSLDVVELVLYVESLRGQEVDTDAIEPEVFTSVNTLWTGFFATLANPQP